MSNEARANLAADKVCDELRRITGRPFRCSMYVAGIQVQAQIIEQTTTDEIESGQFGAYCIYAASDYKHMEYLMNGIANTLRLVR